MNRSDEPLVFTTRYSLLRDVKDTNNRDKWDEFYRIYSAYIQGVCRRKGLKENNIDEMVSQLMAELATLMPSFVYDPSKGRFRGLIKQIVSFRIIDKIRVAGREKKVFVPGQETANGDVCLRDNQPDVSIPNVRERAAQDFAIAVVRRAMQLLRSPTLELSEKKIQIFDDYVICEMDADKIAANHNVPVGQVYLAKNHLMPKFKKACVQAMKELAPEESELS